MLRQPALADTLDAIARDGRTALYEGPIARKIAAGVQAAGGFMTADDLASHRADVLEPLSVDYRGYTVYETPPNSQGLILLEELKIVEGFDLARGGISRPTPCTTWSRRRSWRSRTAQRFAGDPAFVRVRSGELLTDEWAAARRAAIDPAARAAVVRADAVVRHDVVRRARRRRQRLLVHPEPVRAVGLGGRDRRHGHHAEQPHDGLLARPGSPERARAGQADDAHAQHVPRLPRRRTAYIAGNTPGGDYQVQTNLQVLTTMLDFGLDPQAAIDAPRWGDTPAALLVEDHMPAETVKGLRGRGHDARVVGRTMAPMGRAQVIARDASGVLMGGSDARGEGVAAGF